VYLPAPVRAQLESWVEAGYPYETCGVLVGIQGKAQSYITRAVQTRNINSERAHDRYELSPDDFLAADAAAKADGLEIVGIWHSHPDHPARPSETDRVQAWHGWSYLIVSVLQGCAAELRSWRLVNEAFEEESVASWQA
jgi:proteasome lid subunit RPN8/RPN11